MSYSTSHFTLSSYDPCYNIVAYENYVRPDLVTVHKYDILLTSSNEIYLFNNLTDASMELLLVGGGGGGSGTSSVNIDGGGGGGGGAWVNAKTTLGSYYAVDTSYSIFLGTGGAAGVGSAGAPGGASVFTKLGDPSASYVYALGGQGGQVYEGGSAGITSIATNMTILHTSNVPYTDTSFGFGGDAAHQIGAGQFSAQTASVPVEGNAGPGLFDFSNVPALNVGGGGGSGSAAFSAVQSSGFAGFGGSASGGGIGNPSANGESAVQPAAGVFALASDVGGGNGGGGSGRPSSGTTNGGSGSNGLLYMQLYQEIEPFGTPYFKFLDASGITLSSAVENHSDGSKITHYVAFTQNPSTITSYTNSVMFEASANSLEAYFIMSGGGGSGGGGTATFPGQGGGGGGHCFLAGEVGTAIPIDQCLNILVGNCGSVRGSGTSEGAGGLYTEFGNNYWTEWPRVLAGGGGAAQGTVGVTGFGGDISSAGPLTIVSSGKGGDGGLGNRQEQVIAQGISGEDASFGYISSPGQYLLPYFGTLYAGGGGGGGGGWYSINSGVFGSLSNNTGGGGYGGLLGEGGGAGAATVPYGNWNGFDATQGAITSNVITSGAGGGGAGSTPGTLGVFSSTGGYGSGGAWALYLPVYEAGPIPDPSAAYVTPFFEFESGSGLYYKETYSQKICECGPPLDRYEYVVISPYDNVVKFYTPGIGAQANILLIGAGGQGGGGTNNGGQRAGGGGGGGGHLYARGIVGSQIPTDISLNIEIGYTSIFGGYGAEAGADGSGTIFGRNYFSPWVEVSGGTGGTATGFPNGGYGGNIVSTGPLGLIVGGSGGAGGEIDDGGSGNGEAGSNADVGNVGVSGRYLLPTYGFVYVGGGGGGGGGYSGQDSSGGGGIGGSLGLGGAGGLLNAPVYDGSHALAIVTSSYTTAGGGGGGAGMATDDIAYSIGGDGARGMFAMYFIIEEECPTVDSLCGCATFKCPTPVGYVPLVTGGNIPQLTQSLVYAQQVRGSVGRPGYQKVAYGSNTINAFGRYSGAPGGYGQPPRNSFN